MNPVVPMEGKSISVVTVIDVNDRDSALVSELGIGIAEKVEKELFLSQGAVGVYAVPCEDGGVIKSGTMDLLAIQSDSELMLVVDSLKVGSYIIERGMSANQQASIQNVVQVNLPVSFGLSAYDAVHLDVVYHRDVKDTVTWSIVGQEFIQNSAAIAQANNHLREAFRTFGEAVASSLLPVWNQEERMIVCYSGAKWENAYYLASDFKWEQAMDVWMELVKVGTPDKQGAAAYNLAVACEILGRYDIALKWLDFAEGKCYFAQMTTLRKKLQER
jgi:hypothetical protein